MNVPNHISIILDGNGRWAKAHNMPRNFGHKKGSENVETISNLAFDLGVKYLTFYAFSTENWNRPDSEVEGLMKLMDTYLDQSIKKAHDRKMHVRVIGDVSRLEQKLQDKIIKLDEVSSQYDDFNLTIAINYGSRDEIVRATKAMYLDIESGKISKEDIDEKMLASYLDTRGIPDPDLLIRTSGEQRLSNYLLWQLAYSEFYFTDVLWPDFSKEDFVKAIEEYNKRNRRYGGL